MATRRPIKYQLVTLTITGAGVSVSSSGVKTDKLYQRVTGIHVTASDANGLTNSTFQKFEIDRQEIYPQGFEAKLISTGQEVNPNDKFDHDIDEPANDTQVDITYRDGSAAGVVYPYTVNIYLRHENPCDDKESILPRAKFYRALGRAMNCGCSEAHAEKK